MAKKEEVKVKNTRKKPVIHNGLSDALFGHQSMGVQLSQVDTLFQNNRWYLISNMRQILSEIYVEHGLIQTVVNVPVDDALRGGFILKSRQLDEDQTKELMTKMRRENDFQVAGQAMKWNRLFGGAGILVRTGQDPETELDIDAIDIGDHLEFSSHDMWEMFYDKQNVEGVNPAIHNPEYEYYSFYGQKVHRSRFMKLKGLIAPSFIRPRLRGWGFSIVEALVRSINQYLKATDLSFEVLDEFKLDIFKIKNLANTLLQQDGTAKIRQRVALANSQKNYQNSLTMDSEDDYQQKQLSFSGLAEVQHGIRMQVASDLRMPLTKIFGISAAGFSSGEDDIENYNAMVESEVREKLYFDLLKMAELRCQQLFGFVPDDLEGEFKPLRVMSSEQEENVKTQKFNRLLSAKQSNEITLKEFRDACNHDNLLPVHLEDGEELQLESIKEDMPNKEEDQKASLPTAAKPKSRELAKEVKV